jgi:hypothetical protein
VWARRCPHHLAMRAAEKKQRQEIVGRRSGAGAVWCDYRRRSGPQSRSRRGVRRCAEQVSRLLLLSLSNRDGRGYCNKKMSGRRAEVYSLCPFERVVLALESCPKISAVVGHGPTTPYPSSLIRSPLLFAVAFLRSLPPISSPLLHPPPEQVCISAMPVGRGHTMPLPRLRGPLASFPYLLVLNRSRQRADLGEVAWPPMKLGVGPA